MILMDISNLKSCIDHNEATIISFMNDPEYADFYLQSVIEDGNESEIAEVQEWYDEAKARKYWNTLIENAERTARNGKNIESVIKLMDKALVILKSAVIPRV